MASRSNINPSLSDFASLLQENFHQLNCLPIFDVEFFNKDKDWFLLCFLEEQKRNGFSYEVTLSALNSIVGVLADDCYFHNTSTKGVGFLNQNHHIIGESASNKSAICHELSFALSTVIQLFPERYSVKQEVKSSTDNIDNNIKIESKHNVQEYSMIVSTCTEVGLINNLSKINTILLHPDGDVALSKLGYYEQGKNETSGGISLFCDASDGIRGVYNRGTGISQIKIARPVALLNMYVASTGTKVAQMLQKFYEDKQQDGVYGRVFYTWCRSISDLPNNRTKSFINIPSYSHFSCAAALLFSNKFEFRYLLDKSDLVHSETDNSEFEDRLLEERQKQGVKTPSTYSVSMNEDDVCTAGISTYDNETDQNMSSFKLHQTLQRDWWKASNTTEPHLKSIHRKVINMLPKCIWSIEIIRILFRLMSKNLNVIDQRQGDRCILKHACIDNKFQDSIKTSIEEFLSKECKRIEEKKWIMWSTNDDVIAGYYWYTRKMLVMDTLLTFKPLSYVIEKRLGKYTTEQKSHEQIKLEKAMAKVMNYSVVFFSRQYLTNKGKGEGSGQFCHSSDLKPEQILTPLIENGLLIGGNFLKVQQPNIVSTNGKNNEQLIEMSSNVIECSVLNTPLLPSSSSLHSPRNIAINELPAKDLSNNSSSSLLLTDNIETASSIDMDNPSSLIEPIKTTIEKVHNATHDNDFDGQPMCVTKKRGRPNSAHAKSEKWSHDAVDNIIINPKSSTVWKSILIKRQFIVGTHTDLFKMIPSKLFDEQSRFKLIDFLVCKQLLMKGNWFRDAKGTLVSGYLKGSPADLSVSVSLAELGIPIEEYKYALNPNRDNKRRIDGKLINQSYLFSNVLEEQIKNDEWFKDNFEIDQKFIYVKSTLLQTTSNFHIDQFQKQQKERLERSKSTKRKKIEELQVQTSIICGTNIPVKRQRKLKVRED
ncbi:unnamed protein product [Rotaria sp. Silwood1]|nr:unnamed protein product [Rotaria sp. Silwood1]CAF1059089.1 unnamed protein product [Rotaria sp. Silwood1]